jgi:hypothetical protein
MSDPVTYNPSALLPGDPERLRERTFTRWMSSDLRQAAVDFCKNIGLIPIYSETSEKHKTRYLFWSLPKGASFEVRSGRPKEQFNGFDASNRERGWKLLSLHIGQDQCHSAIWITPDHFDEAVNVLAAYGITPPTLANP